jgi:hypothetical protein
MLREAGISVRNTVNISISRRYKDLYENEIKEMWEPGKMDNIVVMMLRETGLKKKIEERGPQTRERLK